MQSLDVWTETETLWFCVIALRHGKIALMPKTLPCPPTPLTYSEELLLPAILLAAFPSETDQHVNFTEQLQSLESS